MQRSRKDLKKKIKIIPNNRYVLGKFVFPLSSVLVLTIPKFILYDVPYYFLYFGVYVPLFSVFWGMITICLLPLYSAVKIGNFLYTFVFFYGFLCPFYYVLYCPCSFLFTGVWRGVCLLMDILVSIFGMSDISSGMSDISSVFFF